jgi:DNA mismatch endonuclease, patch repair protein
VADTVSRSKRSAIMAAVPNRNTQPEKLVRSCLFRAGFRYRLHVRGLPGSPDIVLPRYRAVVFVHGCFWHGHGCNRAKLPSTNVTYWKQKIQRNAERDRKHREALENIDWRVFTIWTCTLGTDLAETAHALQMLRLRIG